jgi:hypothetical protein
MACKHVLLNAQHQSHEQLHGMTPWQLHGMTPLALVTYLGGPCLAHTPRLHPGQRASASTPQRNDGCLHVRASGGGSSTESKQHWFINSLLQTHVPLPTW